MSENIIRRVWNWLTGLKLFDHGSEKTKIDSPRDIAVKKLRDYAKAMHWSSVPRERAERQMMNIILDNDKYKHFNPYTLLDDAMIQYDV